MQYHQITVKVVLSELKVLTREICHKIISYLDREDLKTYNKALKTFQSDSEMVQLLRTQYFIRYYLNQVDRSLYFNFYEQQEFLELQSSEVILVLQNHQSNRFLIYANQYRNSLDMIKEALPEKNFQEQILQELENMIVDPDMPLPRLKRENEGIFCKSTFQNFLVSLKSANRDLDQLPEPLENLRYYFLQNDEKYFKNLFLRSQNSKELNFKIRSLRYTPFEIGYQNRHKFLCKNNQLHNFLVGLYVLSDILLDSVHSFLSILNDPFHLYVEMITRYNIYRNFVVSVEENFSFAFQQYENLYCEVFSNQKPKYRFWRSAMTKWLTKMEHFHEKCSQIYEYCFTKIRLKNLQQELKKREDEISLKYMNFRNKLALSQYQIQVKESISGYSFGEIEEIFLKSSENYEILVIQYIQYLIDLSVNEETVHWCGHSKHCLGQPYLSFQKQFLIQNKSFLCYIQSCRTKQISRESFMKQIFKMEENFFHSNEVKPVMLCKMLQTYNQILTPDNFLNEQLIKDDFFIKLDFTTNDEILKYFNQKAHIQFEINHEDLYFYSINPLISAQQLLTKSISTHDDTQDYQEGLGSENNNPNEYFTDNEENISSVQEYFSDEEQCMVKEISSQKSEEGQSQQWVEERQRKVEGSYAGSKQKQAQVCAQNNSTNQIQEEKLPNTQTNNYSQQFT